MAGGGCVQGFLALPICLPGTAVWKGYRGRLFILSVLRRGAREAKADMKVPPRSLPPMCCPTCLTASSRPHGCAFLKR